MNLQSNDNLCDTVDIAYKETFALQHEYGIREYRMSLAENAEETDQ